MLMNNHLRVQIRLKLESPHHIGVLPKGPGIVLAPTHLYVTGKMIWGALTTRITQLLFTSPTQENYQAVGQVLKNYLICHYFFPAIGDHSTPYYPQYTNDGLFWETDCNCRLSDRELRSRLVFAQVKTAIDHDSGFSAKHGHLFETELISDKYMETQQQIYWVGNVEMTNCNPFIDELRKMSSQSTVEMNDQTLLRINQTSVLARLTIGGESNMGYGRCKGTSSVIEPTNTQNTNYLRCHCPVDTGQKWIGKIEPLVDKEYIGLNGQKFKTTFGYFWAPGSQVSEPLTTKILDPWGRLK